MTTVDLSQKIVAASADYQAADWGAVSAAGGLDMRLSGQLKRGIDLELGLDALVALDASFQKYLSAQGHAYATASAGVKAQVQVPLDLFDEAGVAVRLEAAAQAAAGIRLSLGLSIEDFIALAQADPRMAGLPTKLLRVFLDELVVEGGFAAKMAFSAMAYAKLSLTGALIQRGAQPPGFTVAGEFGAGLKAGAGMQVSANFGVTDPRRLIRRSVDVTVNETVAKLRPLMEDPVQRRLLNSLNAPAKMALRTGFELGLEIAQSGGAFDANNGPRLAQRCVQVILEEGQRFLLERIVMYAMDEFDQQMAALGVTQNDWDRTSAARARLAALLGKLPAEPFEITLSNRAYWADVAAAAVDLVNDVTQAPSLSSDLLDALSSFWIAGELMFTSVERISNAQARAALIGLPPLQASAAFSGPFAGPQPPAILRQHINTTAGQRADAPLTQDVMVDFLVRDIVLDGLRQRFPDIVPVLDIVAGPQGIGPTAAAKSILQNIGAFAPGANGAPDPEASLRALAQGLRAYVDARLLGELVPEIHAATQDRPELRLYVDEVFVPTLQFTVGAVFDRVLNWSNGDVTAQAALREACSSIVMKLLGRSLVVTSDIIVAAAQSELKEELTKAAGHVNDPGGAAQHIASSLSIDRDVVAEVLEETLHIAGDVLGPLPPQTRRRIRALLYEAIDTLPQDADATFLEELRHSFFVPNLSTASELAAELSHITASNLEALMARVLARVAELALAELEELIEQAATEIAGWIDEIEDLARALLDRIVELSAELEALFRVFEERWDGALDELQGLLRLVGHHDNRRSVRQAVHMMVVNEAKTALSSNFFYANLPGPGQAVVNDAVSSTVRTALDSALFDAVWGALEGIALESADLIEDIRGLDPQQDIAAAVLTIFLDRAEDRVRAAFGHNDPSINLSFRVRESYSPVSYFLGKRVDLPDMEIDFTFDLGTVPLPLDILINALRSAIGSIGNVEQAAQSIAENVLAALSAELDLALAEAERDTLEAQDKAVRAQIEDTRERSFSAEIISPAHGSFYELDLELVIALSNVPRSFLGEGFCEQRRILIWLNDTPLDLSRFGVEDTAAQPQAEASPQSDLELPASIVIKGPPGYLDGAAAMRGGQSSRDQHSESSPQGAETTCANDRLSNASTRRTPDDALLKSASRARSLEHRMHSNFSSAARGRSFTPGPSASVGRAIGTTRATVSGAGTPEQSVGQRNTTAQALSGPRRLGRSLRRTDLLKLIDDIEPNLLLKLSLPLAELEEGINTLTVAVLDGRGNRAVQSVSFVANQPSKATPPLTLANLGSITLRPSGGRIVGEKGLEDKALDQPVPPAAEGTGGPRPISSKKHHWIKLRADRTRARRDGWAKAQHNLWAAKDVRELASAVKAAKLRPARVPASEPPSIDDPLDGAPQKASRPKAKRPPFAAGGSEDER